MEKQKKKPEKKTIDSSLSRRDFIKIAGVLSVGLGFWGCASNPKPASKKTAPITKGDYAGSDDYDVVVLGTGMGGSAAGAIAAHYGLKTLILEKNPRPGGSCSYYEKQGFQIDTGAHNFIRANKGPFGDLTKRLEVDPIDFVRAKNTVTVRGINREITIPRNFFLRGMSFPSLVWELGINPVHYLPIANMLRKMLMMSEQEMERLDNVSLEEFIKGSVSDTKTASIAGAALGVMMICPTSKASAGESVFNIQQQFRTMSVSYPKGGAVTIPRTFLKGAEKYGAEVRMNAGVRKIMVKDGKVDHVILDNGETVKTRVVISTTSAKDSILSLVGEEYVPESYAKEIKNIFPSYTAVQAKLMLKKRLVESGVFVGLYPLKTDRDVLGEYVPTIERNIYDGVQGKYIPIYAPVPTNFDPNLAPPGCQIITAVAAAPHLDIELKDPPQIWIDGMMRALRELLPGLDENLIFCDIWSVKATAEWVGKSDGSAISTGQIMGQTGKNRLSHKTPVKGLYLAGDCAGPARGVGTELACQSGIDCADLVANEIKHALVG